MRDGRGRRGGNEMGVREGRGPISKGKMEGERKEGERRGGGKASTI